MWREREGMGRVWRLRRRGDEGSFRVLCTIFLFTICSVLVRWRAYLCEGLNIEEEVDSLDPIDRVDKHGKHAREAIHRRVHSSAFGNRVEDLKLED